MEPSNDNVNEIENKEKDESPKRREFLRKAAILTAAGAAGVLAAQPVASSLLPRSEAADGNNLVIGQTNSGSNPGSITDLEAHVQSGLPGFLVTNDQTGSTAIEGSETASGGIGVIGAARSGSGTGVFASNIGAGLALWGQSTSPFNSKFQNIASTGDRTALITLETGDATPVDWNVGVAGSGNGLGLADGTFFVDNFSSGASLTIDNSNRVGIGTNTPNSKLSLGTFIGDSLFLYDGPSTKYGFGIRSSELRIFHGTDLPGNHTSFGKYDGATFTEFMRLNNQGQLGIGTTTPQTTLQVKGGVSYAIATKTGNYSMATSDFAILADASTTPLTITLPPASTTGMMVHIKKKDASANAVTISRAGTDTIEGSTTKSLGKHFASLTLIADGANTWYVLSKAT